MTAVEVPGSSGDPNKHVASSVCRHLNTCTAAMVSAHTSEQSFDFLHAAQKQLATPSWFSIPFQEHFGAPEKEDGKAKTRKKKVKSTNFTLA